MVFFKYLQPTIKYKVQSIKYIVCAKVLYGGFGVGAAHHPPSASVTRHLKLQVWGRQDCIDIHHSRQPLHGVVNVCVVVVIQSREQFCRLTF